jgi:hypothetical protein
MKKILLLTTTALIGLATAYGQAQDVTQLVGQLQDPNWTVRAASFTALSKVGFATSDQLKLAAIALLTTENANNTPTTSLIPDDGSEDYGEYYGDVIEAVAGLNDPRSISALMGAINTGNMAMNAIASFGESVLEQVIQELSNADESVRESAALTIGKMIDANSVSDPASRAAIGSALATVSLDPDYHVAMAGVSGLLKLFQSEFSVSRIPPTQLAATASGSAYSRVSQAFTGTLTIKNIGASTVSGPFEIFIAGLTPGATVSNATNAFNGIPYMVPVLSSLAPGQSATVALQFKNSSSAIINFTPVIYSGGLN